jgi:cytochrome c oxidase subunit IV
MSSHSSHHDHTKLYAATLGGLLVLTGITVAASYVNFGSANIVVAMVIATLKASLVALIFMHLKDDKPVNAVIFTSSLIFLGIFLGFCMLDVESRDKVATGHLTWVEEQDRDEAKKKAKAAPAINQHAPAAEHH